MTTLQLKSKNNYILLTYSSTEANLCTIQGHTQIVLCRVLLSRIILSNIYFVTAVSSSVLSSISAIFVVC